MKSTEAQYTLRSPLIVLIEKVGLKTMKINFDTFHSISLQLIAVTCYVLWEDKTIEHLCNIDVQLKEEVCLTAQERRNR
jgi:hypothetical protein